MGFSALIEFLIPQSESLSTVNIIAGYIVGRFSILILIGSFLFLFVIRAYFANKKDIKKGLEETDSNRILKIFLLFWLIILVGFTIGNYRTFNTNKNYSRYGLEDRQIIRTCSLTLDGELCRIFSFFSISKENVPMGSKVQVISDPIIKNYIFYYFYPYFELTENKLEAEYILDYEMRSIKKNIL
jgi:hypothetical protein